MRAQMPKQSPRERIKNFASVALGLTREQAIAEAQRCRQCKQPLCLRGCPVEIDIPGFVRLIAQGKFIQAAQKIKEKNSLPAICGRVCPQETQCELSCVLGKRDAPLAIGALERFVADWELADQRRRRPAKKRPWRARVAIVGSGPAGLSCAAELARRGLRVTIFESLHKPGGVLVYGIPEFRLPKRIVREEVQYIQSLGVRICLNVLIGKTYSVEELLAPARFKAVFIATGAGLPQFLGIPGENLLRVYSANEFLTRVNLLQAHRFPEYSTPLNLGRTVAVIGAGNVSFDAARCALRLGAEEVFIVYRRTEKEMPARVEEIENAKEEGVKFYLLTQPTRIIGDEEGFVRAMECIKMRLGAPDASGRRRPLPLAGTQFILNVDTVIVAIGQSPNPLLPQATPGLNTGKGGIILVDERTQATNLKGVYAGGDITTGAATVISAMAAGKRAARAIDNYIRENSIAQIK